MGDTNRSGGAEKTAEQKYTQAELDDMLDGRAAEYDAALANACVDSANEERARISAILSCDEAKARPALAHKLAFSEQGYSAEAAAEILGSAAEESKGPADPLAAAMAGKSPGVSSDDGSAIETEADETEAAANFILNAGRAGTNS